MQITPELIGSSFIIVLISYFIAFAFQIYMAYLNWKQSKVNNQMQDLLNEVKEIKVFLKEQTQKKKK